MDLDCGINGGVILRTQLGIPYDIVYRSLGPHRRIFLFAHMARDELVRSLIVLGTFFYIHSILFKSKSCGPWWHWKQKLCSDQYLHAGTDLQRTGRVQNDPG